MSKMKKYLLTGISYVLVAALAIGGTFAYLQDSDEDVNVMTLGNVQIEQIEQERDENGNLVDFTQAKPAYPAVGTIAWDETKLDVNGTGYKVFDDGLKNVVDKIVTVNNTGKSDAYVRTIVAIEAPEGDPNDLIHFNYNDTGIKVESGFVTKIDGVDYYIVSFVYTDALAAGAKSAPSLMQVFLDSKATNEDCAKFGPSWEVLVLSQAVQAAGFDNAKQALDTAFGAVTATNHPWVNGAPALGWEGKVEDSWYDASENEYVITSAEELAGLAEMVNNGNTFKGKTVKLGANINLGNKAWTPIGQNGDKDGFQGTFDGQGHTISGLNVNQSSRAYQAAGLFGSARYATIKNFKIVNATIKNVDSADNSANGAAVVVGAAQFATTIDNVDVENATVIGNRRVSAIAGYFVGTISNCDVKNVELVATFDDLGNGSYDNCDKVGGIIAYSNGASTITNNTVSNSKISGYRDIGGIAGYATTSTLTGNAVSDVEITILTEHNYKNYTTDAAHDAKAIIGEGSADVTNTSANVTIK